MQLAVSCIARCICPGWEGVLPLFVVIAETLSTSLIDFAGQLPSPWPGLLASPLCEDEPSGNEEEHRLLQAAKTPPPPLGPLPL